MVALVLIIIIIFLLFYLKARAFTLPEYLERRFDERSRYYFSGVMISMNIIIDTAAALYAGALVVQLILPEVSLWFSVVVLGVIAGVHTIAGGLKAVVYTDVVQAVLLFAGALIVSVLSFLAVGGSWADIAASVAESDLSVILPATDPVMPWPGLLTGVFLLGLLFLGHQPVHGPKDTRGIESESWSLRRTVRGPAQGAGHFHYGHAWHFLAGICIRPTSAEYLALAENSDLIFPTLKFDLLPSRLRGLITAALVAAIEC